MLNSLQRVCFLFISVYILLIFLILTCKLTLKNQKIEMSSRKRMESLVITHVDSLLCVLLDYFMRACFLLLLYTRWDCTPYAIL